MPCFSTLANVIDSSGEIYGYKVDRLLQDAIKVRTDLTRSAGGKEGDDGDDAADSSGGPTTRKTRAFHGNTIVKNPSSISVKKFDLEFAVDPLFRKTSAAFDQGGARGLLLNHISSQGRCQLIFDSSDSVDIFRESPDTTVVEETAVDMSDLLATVGEAAPQLVSGELQICEPFHDFLFQGWAPNVDEATDEQNVGGAAVNAPAALTMDAEYMGDGSDDGGLDDMNLDQSYHEHNEASAGSMDALFNAGPSFDDMDAGLEDGDDDEDGGAGEGKRSTRAAARQLGLLENNEFSWLQGHTNNKGWHGEGTFTVPLSKAAEAKKAGSAKPKKEKMQINFGAAQDWDSLLGKSKAATVLAKSTLNAQEPNLLPVDLQYTVDDLTRLFMLPTVQGRTLISGEAAEASMDNDDDEVAPDGWGVEDSFGGEYTSASPVLEDGASPTPMGYDEDDSQFGGVGGGSDGEDDLPLRSETPGGTALAPAALKLIANVKQTNKINITYAQKAKTMDVKKLKQHIWTEMTDAAAPSGAKVPEAVDVVVRAKETIPDLTTAQTFTSMYEQIPQKVDRKMAENMSVPIMFVCLLYLANDKELRINGTEGMDNLVIQQKEAAN
jgi:condensin complex subunit 2